MARVTVTHDIPPPYNDGTCSRACPLRYDEGPGDPRCIKEWAEHVPSLITLDSHDLRPKPDAECQREEIIVEDAEGTCPACKDRVVFTHTHQTAYGISCTHHSGSERYVCPTCDEQFSKAGSHGHLFKFTLD